MDLVVIPRDSHCLQPAEVRRLTGQNQAILSRLEQGPASARELAALSLKYTSRVSDLRKAGYDVRCREDATTGASTYFLVREAEREPRGHNVNVAIEGRLI